MKKLSKKARVFMAAAGSVLVLTCAIGVTLALLKTQSEPATNDFKGTAVNIAVVENGNDYENESKEGLQNVNTFEKIQTGNKVAKDVKIKNLTSDEFPTGDTYVRVRLVPILRYLGGDRDGEIVPFTIEDNKLEYTMAGDFGDKWVTTGEGADTYYYYKKALTPGESTDSLISEVAYNGELPRGIDCYLELQVLAEGISAKQNGSVDDSWEGVHVDGAGLIATK